MSSTHSREQGPFTPPIADDAGAAGGDDPDPVVAAFRPLVCQRGWVVFAGIVQLLFSLIYGVIAVVMLVVSGEGGWRPGPAQILAVFGLSGLFALLGVFSLLAGIALGRGGRDGAWEAASRNLARYFVALGAVLALAGGMFAIAITVDAIATL